MDYLAQKSFQVLLAAIDLDQHAKKNPAPMLAENVNTVLEIMERWHLDDMDAFKQGLPIHCLHIVEMRDGEERWRFGENATYEKLAETMREERDNLRAILDGKPEADAKKGMEFCLHLAGYARMLAARKLRRQFAA